ncbi:MAG: ABC transporter substrate-binding protein [Candidatus Sumerlaeia bacterium]
MMTGIKWIRTAAALLIALALSAGSPRPTAGAPEAPITLTLWQGFKFEEVTVFEEIARGFERTWLEKTGRPIRIESRRVPFDSMIPKIKTAALARTTPDIAIVDALKVIDLAYGNVALPLDLVDGFPWSDIQTARSEFINAAFDSNVITVKGETHLYGLPAQTTCLALFWNKQLFQKFARELTERGLSPDRPPRDWDEFIEYGKVLTKPEQGIYAYAERNSLWFTFPFFNTFGAEFIEIGPDGKYRCVVDSPRARAAVAYKADLWLKHRIEAGAWREGAKDADQGFLNGSYAMCFNGPWNVEKFKSAGVDLGVGLIPRLSRRQAVELGLIAPGDGDDVYNRTITTSSNIGGQNAIVFRTTAHPEAALAFLVYFTSPAAQKIWAEKLGQIPVNLKAHENLDTSRFPEIRVFMEQIRFARRLPPLPLYGTLETDIFNPEMNLILNGQKSVEDGLAAVKRRIEAEILTKVNEF